jgi:phospholipid transport system substrate-binding protein
VYTARLANFGGQTFKMRGSRGDSDGVIVSTDVISPDSTSAIRMDWRLVNDNGAYKISDIIVEGISMAVTQRSEFASVVQRNGGQVRGLIALMREKTASAAYWDKALDRRSSLEDADEQSTAWRRAITSPGPVVHRQ